MALWLGDGGLVNVTKERRKRCLKWRWAGMKLRSSKWLGLHALLSTRVPSEYHKYEKAFFDLQLSSYGLCLLPPGREDMNSRNALTLSRHSQCLMKQTHCLSNQDPPLTMWPATPSALQVVMQVHSISRSDPLRPPAGVLTRGPGFPA